MLSCDFDKVPEEILASVFMKEARMTNLLYECVMPSPSLEKCQMHLPVCILLLASEIWNPLQLYAFPFESYSKQFLQYYIDSGWLGDQYYLLLAEAVTF